nr:orf143EGC136 [uncultured bacterium]
MPRPRHVPDRETPHRRHPAHARSQIVHAQCFDQLLCIAPVGRDPIAGLTCNQRGRTHGAIEALGSEVAIYRIPAGAGLVDETHAGALGTHADTQPIQITLQHPEVAQILDLTGPDGISGHDRVFVNIQPDEDGGIVTHAGLH